MLSDNLECGDRVELTFLEAGEGIPDDEIQPNGRKKVHRTRIFNVLDFDELELEMPFQEGRLQLLPEGRDYEVFFSSSNGLFRCTATIAERYKTGNIFLLRVIFTSELKKAQRREYYRLSCTLKTRCGRIRSLRVQKKDAVIIQDTIMTRDTGIIVNISGGGARLLCAREYEPDSLIYMTFSLKREREGEENWKSRENVTDDPSEITVQGRIIETIPVQSKQGNYQSRVEFVDMSNSKRDAIVKYIFEEERKMRSMKK